MTIPIICHSCGRRGKVATVTEGMICPCGSNDLDLDDTLEVTREGAVKVVGGSGATMWYVYDDSGDAIGGPFDSKEEAQYAEGQWASAAYVGEGSHEQIITSRKVAEFPPKKKDKKKSDEGEPEESEEEDNKSDNPFAEKKTTDEEATEDPFASERKEEGEFPPTDAPPVDPNDPMVNDQPTDPEGNPLDESAVPPEERVDPRAETDGDVVGDDALGGSGVDAIPDELIGAVVKGDTERALDLLMAMPSGSDQQVMAQRFVARRLGEGVTKQAGEDPGYIREMLTRTDDYGYSVDSALVAKLDDEGLRSIWQSLQHDDIPDHLFSEYDRGTAIRRRARELVTNHLIDRQASRKTAVEWKPDDPALLSPGHQREHAVINGYDVVALTWGQNNSPPANFHWAIGDPLGGSDIRSGFAPLMEDAKRDAEREAMALPPVRSASRRKVAYPVPTSEEAIIDWLYENYVTSRVYAECAVADAKRKGDLDHLEAQVERLIGMHEDPGSDASRLDAVGFALSSIIELHERGGSHLPGCPMGKTGARKTASEKSGNVVLGKKQGTSGHTPIGGTVLDCNGRHCTQAVHRDYPLSAHCVCGAENPVIYLADPTAEWTHDSRVVSSRRHATSGDLPFPLLHDVEGVTVKVRSIYPPFEEQNITLQPGQAPPAGWTVAGPTVDTHIGPKTIRQFPGVEVTSANNWYVIQRGAMVRTAGSFGSEAEAKAEAERLNAEHGFNPGSNYIATQLNVESAKVAEIISGIMATNPGMPRHAAKRIAERTVEKYPAMVGR